jgi:MscS family membrane protein
MKTASTTAKRIMASWFVLVALCNCAAAQTPSPPAPASTSSSKDPLNRQSPQDSVNSFLEACRSRNYERAQKYLDLRKLPKEHLKDGPQLAQQLERILDHDAEFDVAALSHDNEAEHANGLAPDRVHVASFNTNRQTLELQLERVRLRPGLFVWLFSAGSVNLIPRLAQLTSDSRIERSLPAPLVTWRIADTSLWQWIALVALAIALFAFSKLLSGWALALVEPVLKRIAPSLSREALAAFLGPVRLLLSVTALRLGMELIGPSALPRRYLERGLALLFFLGVFWLCCVIIDVIIGRLRSVLPSKHQSFSYSVLPLASRILKITILLLTIAAILGDWGYNTTTILAGVGVGGIAIALAAQKTIENLFGSVSVISDRPVSVGDFCRFGDKVGTVEDIGLRSTRIRTLDRTLVTVPNGQFSSMTLENFSRRDKMLFHLTLNLQRDTTPEQVRTLLQSITKALTEHPKVEAGEFPARFVGVGAYSLDLEIFVYIRTRDGDEFLHTQQDLLLWILDAVESAGTALALPTQASISYSFGNAPHQNGAPVQHTAQR